MSTIIKSSDIKNLTFEELKTFLKEKGFEPYRAVQIFKWIYKKCETNFDNMTDISKSLRGILKESFENIIPEIVKKEVSRDGTIKYAFRTHDDLIFESVFIPDEDRRTICLSTQIGCALACRFCRTGKMGFIRNLEPYEIISQIIAIKRDTGEKITNLVFMGMGEPLLNFDNLVKSLKIILSEEGMNFSPRKVTVSTAGIPDKIERLGKEVRVSLSLSLNAPDDEKRSEIMPINRKYSIAEVMKAVERYPNPPKKMFTVEYVLIKGINDSPDDAHKLARLLKSYRVRFKVNLIRFNEFEGCEFEPPPEKNILKFQEILLSYSISTTLRKRKGYDISAACGQLGGRISNV